MCQARCPNHQPFPFGTRIEEAEFSKLEASDIIVVAAAGNWGKTNKGAVLLPAAYESVVSVAAVDVNEKSVDFSVANRFVDIGLNILSTSAGKGSQIVRHDVFSGRM